ncbi:MAG: hypothetical protein NTX12_02760 [Actinobacteria bacterium]|nr:hypothetical protein [Actinomycetota bacterium]
MNDEFIKRAFRHMAWANSEMLKVLGSLTDEEVNLSAWNPDRTVAKIAHHIIVAEGRLISRATGSQAPQEDDPPSTAAGVYALFPIFEERDAKILSLVDLPEEIHKFKRFGMESEFLTSTILVQAFHHASEHRAQISDILAANGRDVFNLDAVDLWHFEVMERNGL